MNHGVVGFATGYPSSLQPRAVEVSDDVDELVVEVKGLSRLEVEAALRLYSRARQVSSETAHATYEHLLAVLLAEAEPMTDPNEATAAKSLAAVRAQLLATTYLTHESLAERRHSSPNATRTWVKRNRDAHNLFTVLHGGRTLMPAFQFDEDGGTRGAVSAVIHPLRIAGLDGWQLWEWFASPTGWLDGDSPLDLLDHEPDLVLDAATHEAEELERNRASARALGQLPTAEAARHHAEHFALRPDVVVETRVRKRK